MGELIQEDVYLKNRGRNRQDSYSSQQTEITWVSGSSSISNSVSDLRYAAGTRRPGQRSQGGHRRQAGQRSQGEVKRAQQKPKQNKLSPDSPGPDSPENPSQSQQRPLNMHVRSKSDVG